MDLIYWSVRSSSRRGGDGVKGYRCFSHLRPSLVRVHENLVQHPINNIWIGKVQILQTDNNIDARYKEEGLGPQSFYNNV